MTRQIADEVNESDKGLALWWLGNAGFAIRFDEVLMFIDPVIEIESEDDYTMSETGLRLLHELPLRAKEVERTDIIMLTHHHGDHSARKTLNVLKETGPVFICPESCLPVLDRVGVGRERVRKVVFGQMVEYGGVSVEPVRAVHGGRRGESSPDAEPGAGYVVRAGGHSVFHPGDTVLLEEHNELKDIEILLLPICHHSRTLIELPGILSPKHIVAMHYDTYEVSDDNRFWTYGDPEVAKSKMRFPERLTILKQGEIFRVS